MLGYGHDESAPTPGGVYVVHFVVGCGYFIGYSWGVSWANVGISRNVRNVFILCMLHIHKPKVWFLPCKSMVFGVQKGGFCVAKVCFLFFECYVVANRSQRISWANVDISQNVCHIIPIC